MIGGFDWLTINLAGSLSTSLSELEDLTAGWAANEVFSQAHLYQPESSIERSAGKGHAQPGAVDLPFDFSALHPTAPSKGP
ncbi:hypothetical protein A1D17_04005 [Pseudomonas fluorescens]|uniref:Uncharacterized protein n=1 Tax=Pseudomonas fluorescens TaxID=294 RepID=A0A166QQW8_PSEFL|nr:hypothetical protein A1D17_04005 [Pseudomonas fluorescens]